MVNRKIILPKEDKKGNSRLSYSQIKCFKESKKEYIKRYILKESFYVNKYMTFGNKVGKAIEANCYDNFSDDEKQTLLKVERLDEFEKFVVLDFGGFMMYGYIDTCSLDMSRIIDYKTGSINKHHKYLNPDYNQLHYYALSLRQQYGITPISAQVNYIIREGNPYKGVNLRVSKEKPILLNIDISEKTLNKVYWDTIEIAKEMESFYLKYLETNKLK